MIEGWEYYPGLIHAKGEQSPNYKHGCCNTRLYTIWKGMKRRTLSKNFKSFKNYGGRGIIICDEWKNSFKSFQFWALNNGYSDCFEIDRINNNGNYEPNNCRWVTRQINCINKRLRTDWGIFHSRNGYYIKIKRNGILYYGGYVKDKNIATSIRDNLLIRINQ